MQFSDLNLLKIIRNYIQNAHLQHSWAQQAFLKDKAWSALRFLGTCQTTENISNQIKRLKKIVPSGSVGSHREIKIQLLAKFCPPSVWHEIPFIHPAYDMKFADTCVLTSHNWQKWKRGLTCPCNEIYFLQMCDTYNCDYLQHSTFRFNLIDFQLNTDFPSQSYAFYRKIT